MTMIKFIFILFYFILFIIFFKEIMQWVMQPMKSMDVCEWYTVEVLWIFTQDMGLNQFRFFNMVRDILVKVKLEVTRTSTVLNVFGSKWSSDVTRFIFCPNFCKIVTSILQLDLMNFFRKSMSLVQPHNPRNGNFDRQYFDNIS